MIRESSTLVVTEERKRRRAKGYCIPTFCLKMSLDSRSDPKSRPLLQLEDESHLLLQSTPTVLIQPLTRLNMSSASY
jgi:hypothetical protein